MLKLNHKAMRGTDISDVPFPGLPIVLDKLLVIGWEFVFPRTMPFRFLFGPGITILNCQVRPVEDSVRATFGNDLAITNATHPPPPGGGFNTVTAYKCKFHVAYS